MPDDDQAAGSSSPGGNTYDAYRGRTPASDVGAEAGRAYAPIRPRGDPNEHRQAMADEQEHENNQILLERRRRNTLAAARMRERQKEREQGLLIRRNDLMARMQQLEAELAATQAATNDEYEATLDQLSRKLEEANDAMRLVISEVEALVEIAQNGPAGIGATDTDVQSKIKENEAARRTEIERVLREKAGRGDLRYRGSEAGLRKTGALLAPALFDQLRPLAMDAQAVAPLRRSASSGSGDAPSAGVPSSNASPGASQLEGAAGGASLGNSLAESFDKSVREDVSNMILTGLVRRSHMFLYAEDPWSEGYSLPLLESLASDLGARVVSVDIPDWSMMTAQIDPVLEDLTIVSHPYTPPPDLDSGHDGKHGHSAGRMSFFSSINRKRADDEGDIMREQVVPRGRHEEEEEGDEGDEAAEQDAGGDAAGNPPLNRQLAAFVRELKIMRGELDPRGDVAAERDGGSGEPTLSPEMMTNPLSSAATEQLDHVLSDFVASPRPSATGGKPAAERPRIIALKHLGDLLNTRIGYTLFSRLVAAVERHNRAAESQPTIVVGLLHPSVFHPDTPPPGIPPFDGNPSTPVALMPQGEEESSDVKRLRDFTRSLVGGSGKAGQRSLGRPVSIQLVPMDDSSGGGAGSGRAPRVLRGLSGMGSEGKVLDLPLFSRVGIPPPATAVMSEPCNMQAPLQGEGGRVVTGSLRQLSVASQCLERNARVVRNICLLYQIPGLELESQEADYMRRLADVQELAAAETSDGGLVFRRRPLYEEPAAEDGGAVVSKQVLSLRGGRKLWSLDQRALMVMLLTMPDDVGRRYFFSETFLHRWVSLAQALAVKERVSPEAMRRNPALLAEAGRLGVLGSRHLRQAWTQLLQSFAALKRGVLGHPPASTESTGATKDGGGSATDALGVSPLHSQMDFDEVGIGRRAEDTYDVAPVLEGTSGSGSGAVAPSDSGEGQPEEPPAAPVTWSDIGDKLDAGSAEAEATVDEGASNSGSPGATNAAAPSPQKRIRAAKRNPTEYEARLLGSIVDPDSIPSGFGQVCVKEETVTTLQEIITLPMLRPEYFSRGVLRRYGVSGILLFGPPGVGKTMLAKAVAKESGSVVLNIRASDVYDKYVGEGEKLAEAVFTLARKLAPCVIFIDEVDALFSARSSGEANKFRRDIMNQIMSEWDGINTARKGSSSDKDAAGQGSRPPPQVMVMAATNRPFDLDDAILRRLPRRILVDLPEEADRVQILKIHLRGEELDPDVDLQGLAKRTASFSGSDLKNLCVAAAQAALRERVRAEVAAAAPTGEAEGASSDSLGVPLIEQLKHVRRDPGAEPAGIKVAARHFDAALKKVTPSSSEKMESLAELRKWDKLYGDGAQERSRKVHSIGFASAAAAAAK
ncbi:hypothetical protein GGF46_005531 [Coemansia sp. RSA 552]|nr:hypothetical protein GGF46_005531 [Coemansia sp. RSA 552]